MPTLKNRCLAKRYVLHIMGIENCLSLIILIILINEQFLSLVMSDKR